VKGVSPTRSGLQLTPMMLGLLITSVASGQLITRWGRYRIFPILGTAVTALALGLLSRLAVGTPLWVASVDMIVLGLGLGMVMQVLVLAVQNAVDYRNLGVATSGSTMFRSIGGSIGVSLFGAIFSNRLHTELAQRLPPGVHPPSTASPAALRHLPSELHAPYIQALTHALQPVYLVAAVISVLAFVGSWLLPDLPLRRTHEAEGIGEAFASPREGDSERELERVLGVIARKDERWRAYAELVQRAEVDIDPTEAWLVARLGEHATPSLEELAGSTGVDRAAIAVTMARLEERGLVTAHAEAYELTPAGRRVLEALVAVRRATLEELVRDWSPEDHQQLSGVLDRLARSLASEMPSQA
jgi:DNA-binding MarR family transcriptional regulator